MEKPFPSPRPYLSGLDHFCSLRTVLPTSVLASSLTAILHRNQSDPVKISQIMSLHYQNTHPIPHLAQKNPSLPGGLQMLMALNTSLAQSPPLCPPPTPATLASLLALESSRHILVFNSLLMSPLPRILYDGPSGKLLRNYMSYEVWH